MPKRGEKKLVLLIRSNIRGQWKNYLFGRAIYFPGGRFGPSVQRFYQLIVVVAGSLRVSVDGKNYDLAPGDGILQHPGQREFYRFSEKSESEHTWYHVAPQLLSAHDKKQLRELEGVHKVPSSVQLLIGEGLASADGQTPDMHEAMMALGRAALLLFAAHARRVARRRATPLHPALERALEIATAHYAELRSAQELARRAGISIALLRDLCRRGRGESPTEMIWRLKVEHAIQLIRSTGLTLGEIAAQCGYANPFHLSRSVKKATGRSPRALRQWEWNRQSRQSTTTPHHLERSKLKPS